MHRETTSRRRQFGGRVQRRHEPLPRSVHQHGPLAAHRLRDHERPAAGGRRVQQGGVELDELQVGQHRAGLPGQRHAVAGGRGRVGGGREQLPRTAGRQNHDVGVQLRGHRTLAFGPHIRQLHPGDAVAARQQPPHHGVLEDLQPAGFGQAAGHPDQDLGDAGSGPVAAGMQDPRRRVRTLQPERESAAVPVEGHTPVFQGGDLPRRAFAQQADGAVVVQLRARGERVRHVGRHGIPRRNALCGHRGDAALRVPGVGLGERALGDQRDGGVRPFRGERGGVEPGDAGPHHRDAPGRCAVHGLAASIRSSATRAGTATASGTVIRLSTSPPGSSPVPA